jgi:hypothetical protein
MTAEIQTRRLNEMVEVKFNFADIKWKNNNKDTFIIYHIRAQKVCFSGQEFLNTLILSNLYLSPEGEQSFYYPNLGITAFGQSFSHSIARYDCEENLSGIMERVSIKAFFSTVKTSFALPEIELHKNQIHFKIYNS